MASPPRARRTRRHATQVREVLISETTAQHSRMLCLQATGHPHDPAGQPAGGQAAPGTQALLGTGAQDSISPGTVPSSGIGDIQPAEVGRGQNHFILRSFRRGNGQQHLTHCLLFKLIHTRQELRHDWDRGELLSAGAHVAPPGGTGPPASLAGSGIPSCPQVRTGAGCSQDTQGTRGCGN